MSSISQQMPVEQARQLFTREGLPFPPLPDDLAANLEVSEDSESVFSTRELRYSPYNMEVLVGELVDGEEPDDYAVLGFDGHGVNSWAVHYVLLQPGLALFLQLPWGGAYEDADENRALIARTFEWAEALQGAIQRILPRGLIPPGWRLVVVRSDFFPSAWTWLPHPSPGADAVDWHETDDVLNQAGIALIDLAEGKRCLP